MLLYELLTGTTPFSGKELRSAAYAEIQRIIREVEPPMPSMRLSNNTDTIASVAARRHTEPKRLGTIVRGDLDWIVMKALEKDRQRRYETANGLAMDVRRYLSGEAVVAAPPSTAYRFKKFIRRNRVMVSAGSAVAAALLIGVIAFAWQAKVASDQRDIAVAAQKAEAEQRQLAEAEAAYREALETYRAALPTGHPYTATALNNRANLLKAENKLAEAESVQREALTIYRTALPAGHPTIAIGLNNLASVLQSQNKFAEAEQLFRESLAIRRAALPARHPEIANGLTDLASLLLEENKLAEAEPLMREALAIRRAAFPAGDPEIAKGLQNLAWIYWSQGKLDKSVPLFEEALKVQEAAVGRRHPETLVNIAILGVNYKAAGKITEGIALLEEAYRASKRDQSIPWVGSALLDAYTKAADPAKPESVARVVSLTQELLAGARDTLPTDSPELAVQLGAFSQTLLELKAFDEAEPLIRQALAINRAATPAAEADIAGCLSMLSRAQQALGKHAEARAGWNEAIAMLRKGSPEGSALLGRVLWSSASARLENMDAAAALPELEEAVSMAEKVLPADHPQLKEYRETLGKCKAAIEAQKK